MYQEQIMFLRRTGRKNLDRFGDMSFALRSPILSLAALFVLAPSTSFIAQAQTVTILETTADEHSLLVHKQSAFREGQPVTGTSITIDPAVRLQTMDGFGASLTDSSASVIHQLVPAQGDALMHELFDPAGPLGLTLLRQPIGASDFSSKGDYSYDDPPASAGKSGDVGLKYFSASVDDGYLFPLLRKAEQLNPQMRVIALPWSAPAWMKVNRTMRGGKLDDRFLEAYSNYLAKTVEAYSARSIPLFALSLQNEPLNDNPGYPTQDMQPEQEVKLAAILRPKLDSAGRTPLLFGYEHNWGNLDYPTKLLDLTSRTTPAGAPELFSGISFHCYQGSESAQAVFLQTHTRTSLWFTECSAINSSSFAETFLWQGRHLLLGVPLNGARSVMLWNVVLNGNGGPHNGGCSQCTALIMVDKHGSDTTLRRTASYYVLAHAAPFVHPGAVHIAAHVGSHVPGEGPLLAEAFENIDGTFVLIALNTVPLPAEVNLRAGTAALTYTLPGRSIVTFTWGIPRATVAEGTYQLDVSSGTGPLALEAKVGVTALTLEKPLGVARQLWSITRLATGKYEIRNVGNGQALAVSTSGTLTALTLSGARTAALPLLAKPEGFCIEMTVHATCSAGAELGADATLPGNLLLVPMPAFAQGAGDK